MPLRRPPTRPIFFWIAIVAALDIGCDQITPAGEMRALVNGGFGIVILLLLRQVFASGAMYNPLGPDRDFSPAPALRDLLIGVAFALATFAWAAACGMADRIHLLPDTELAVYSVALIPLFGLLAGFIFFFGRAIFWGLFGRRRKAV